MPDTTAAPLSIPRPLASDPVALFPDTARDTADRLHVLLDGVDNAALTAANGTTVGTSAVHSRGMVGFLNCETLAIPAGGLAVGTSIATLPVGFRPAVNMRGTFVTVNGGVFALLVIEVQPDGDVTVSRAVVAGDVVYGSVAYPL